MQRHYFNELDLLEIKCTLNFMEFMVKIAIALDGIDGDRLYNWIVKRLNKMSQKFGYSNFDNFCNDKYFDE